MADNSPHLPSTISGQAKPLPEGEGAVKVWWKSRTLILNAVAAGLVSLEAGTGLLQPLLPVNLYTGVAVGLPVLNAMLRVVTTSGVSIK